MKDRIWEILNKPVEDITGNEYYILINFLTYEMLEEYQNQTGEAIDIEGLTTEEKLIVTGKALLDFLNNK